MNAKTLTLILCSAFISCSYERPALIPEVEKAAFFPGFFHETDHDVISKKTSVTIDRNLRKELGSEGYRLYVTKKGLSIESASDTGAFYASQTIKQLTNKNGVRCAKIEDRPRFSYRGIHLDVSRHFFKKETIFKILDEMAYYKLNVFHFHLTDNGGWRIKIDAYPKLTELGAFRIMKDWDEWWKLPNRYFCDENTLGAYGGYYTKDELREIVDYARKLYITIIPEIEFPAHSDPVFVGYPHLNCTKTAYGNGEFCPVNEEVYIFAENVLREVMEIFPSKIIHIGGDEAGKKAWQNCPDCLDFMKKEKMKSHEELQCHMTSRLQRFLNKNGRKMAGWDQILSNNDLSSSSIIYSYRGERGGIEAANRGLKTVLTPGEILYFDWYQASPSKEIKAMYGYSPIKKMFLFDPLPITPERAALNESLVAGKEVSSDSVSFILPDKKEYVIGVQGCAWTEYIPTEEHLEYMMFPRLLAISEKGWSPENSSTWMNFKRRVGKHIPELKERGINSYELHDAPEITSDGKKVTIESENPEALLTYTIDGSTPCKNSKKYIKPIPVGDKAFKIKAIAFTKEGHESYIKEAEIVPGKKLKEFYSYSIK